MLRKAIKYTAIFIGSILLLVVLLLAFTQTGWFRESLRKTAVRLVNQQLNGELRVGQLEGNLYNSLQLTDITLRDGDSVLIAIDAISLKYKLKYLATKLIEVDSVQIHSPQFNLWYKDSATLQLAHVFDKMKPKEGREPPSFPLSVEVNHIDVTNGQGQYQLKFGQAPLKADGIGIQASGVFADKHVAVTAHSMQLQLTSPVLELQHGFAQIRKLGSSVYVDSLYLQTTHSLLEGRGQYLSNTQFELMLKGHPINEKELKAFLPQLPIRTIPQLSMQLRSENDEMHCDAQVARGHKTIGVTAILHQLPQAILDPEMEARFQATLAFNQFVPEEWLDIKQTDTHLNGSVRLEGADVLDYKKDLDVLARLNKSTYKGIVTDTLHFDARQHQNVIDADMLVVYNQSRSEGQLHIIDLYNRPVYTANFNTVNLDVEAIEPSIKNTIVNGHIIISGMHILSGPRQFNAEARLANSLVFDYPIDSVYLRSDLQHNSLRLDTCLLVAQDNKVDGRGEFDLVSKRFAADALLTSTDLSHLQALGAPLFEFDRGVAKVTLNGTAEAFEYAGQLKFNELAYESIRSDTLTASVSGRYSPDSILSSGHIGLRNVHNGALQLDTISACFDFDNKHLQAAVELAKHDTLSGQINTDICVGDTISVLFHHASLKLPMAHFYLSDTIQKVDFFNQTLLVDNLDIKDKIDTTFNLRAFGRLSANDSTDFELNVDNFNLYQLNKLWPDVDTVSGWLSLHSLLLGQQGNIELDGEYMLEAPVYGEMILPAVKGQVNYLADTLRVDGWLPQLDSSLYAKVEVPFKVDRDSINGYSFSQPQSFEAKLVFDSLKVSQPELYAKSYMKAGIELNGSLNASGELAKPQFYGDIKMKDGYLSNHKRGVYYSNASGQFIFDGQNVTIDSLYIGSDKGYFKSKGHLLFDSTIVSGKLVAADLLTDIKNFHIIQHKNYDINVSGNPYYKTDSVGNPQFGGKVLVNRSSFYIPGLMADESRGNQPEDEPLLVLALQKEDSTYEDAEVEVRSEELTLLKHLRGRMTIDIPRSTWLKGENMNIEIGGDFDIAKTGDYFELFGDVEIIRGNYILYGRKFTIDEGVITFMGGEETDPRLDISAEYVFRGSDREKHSLKLSVSEYLSEPTISFTLDDSSISESDAVSIMVFGKTMDELSYAGQNGIVGSVGSNMLADMVTSSLNSTIGNRFKLDMIEVNATENWTSAAFVVGKYITNDLFVIYQRGFGETEDDEITPETITLEYELNKLLFFRLQGGASKSSGFDVILKFESAK